MRSMYTKEELFVAAAKKKPRWQQLIDSIDSLSIDDIQNLNEPLWVRQALERLQITKGTTQKQRLAAIVAAANAADEKAYQERYTLYEVRLWEAGSATIEGIVPFRESVKWNLDIRQGEPFLIRSDDMFVLAGEFFKLSDQDWKKVVDSSTYFKNMTQQEYFNYYKEVYLNGIS